MEFSIKSPNSIFWKTGYRLEQVTELYQSGKVTNEWLICPLGEASRAVTMAEFNQNPSIFKKDDEVNDSASESINPASKNKPMSVAQMGWAVFFSSLFGYFLLTIVAGGSVTVFLDGGEGAVVLHVFISILAKGIEALIIAGAIVALLGHAYEKVAAAK